MPIDIASGSVYSNTTDISIPGRFPLSWGRSYNSALAQEDDSPFGPGWVSPYFAKLTRIGKDYHFRSPAGALIQFPDPEDSVEAGAIVRDPGSFHEIGKQGIFLRITHWTHAGKVTRYQFQPGRNGQWWPMRTLVDEAGNGLDLAWDEQGRLQGIRQKVEKRTLSVAYSAAGRIASVSFRHQDGRLQLLSRYEYDSKGRLSAAQDALGAAERYEYDKSGRLCREIAKDGGVFSFKYDDKGRCIRSGGLDNYDLKVLRYLDHIGWTEVTNSLGKTNRYQWLGTGQVVLHVDPLGGKTETEYDAHGRIILLTDPMGGKTAYEYDEEGNRSKVTDALGNETLYEYNASHLVVRQTDPNGGKWEKAYDSSNRPVSAKDPQGNACSIEYDPSGNPVQLKKPDGSVIKRAYSMTGTLIEESDWEGRITSYLHDEFGRVAKRRDPDGSSAAYRYDLLGRMVEAAYSSGKSVKYEYDVGGNLVRIASSVETPVTFRYGSCRRLLEKKYGAGRSVRFTWGSEPDRLETVINEIGEIHRFKYDACDRVVAESGFDDRAVSFQVDLAGRCTGRTNGLGESIEWQLDPLGRIIGETLPDGEASAFAYDKLGNLLSAANAAGALAFDRDAVGRILKEDQNGFSIVREYGPMGEVRKIQTDAGIQFQYAYGGNGLASSIDANGLGVFEFTRNERSQISSLALPGGLRMEQSFDSRGRLLRQAVSGPESGSAAPERVLERDYSFDDSGMLLSVVDGQWGRSRYAHDEAKRLTHFGTEMSRTDWRLNPCGDPVAAILDGEREIPCSYGPGGELLERDGITYKYDGAGRLVSKSDPKEGGPARHWTYSWDAKDRLRSVTTPTGETWEYAYDALGRRIGKKGPNREIRYIWDQDVLLHEIEVGKDIRTWGFEPYTFKPLFRIQSGHLLSIICDHLGTPREMVDSLGKVAWSTNFDPWGNPLAGKGSLEDCPIRFQGQYSDPESGFYYNRYRYYDPKSGRFISKDPIGLEGGLSAFQYVPNPTHWVDPLGLCGEEDGPEEIIYRTMSEKHYKRFVKSGGKKVPATGETFTSPTQAFSEGYTGVLVEFRLKPGTTAKLEAIGVSDGSPMTSAKYPEMPLAKDTRNWTANNAMFKEERGQVNIGLGKGKALDTFNENIVGHNVIRP